MYRLGSKPASLKVNLYRDAEFAAVLTRQSSSGTAIAWGADVFLMFPDTLVDPDDPDSGPITWEATVAGDDDENASFVIPKAQVNQRANGDAVELWVGNQCWGAGTVSMRGIR